jgi:hypothetical protein
MGALCEQAGVLYNILLETQACEVSQRIIAMDNASTNAGEMVGRFTLFYNRYVALLSCDWAPLYQSGVAFFLPLLVLYRRGCLTVFVAAPFALSCPCARHRSVTAVPVRPRLPLSCLRLSLAPSL